jgi:hypothetical protein
MNLWQWELACPQSSSTPSSLPPSVCPSPSQPLLAWQPQDNCCPSPRPVLLDQGGATVSMAHQAPAMCPPALVLGPTTAAHPCLVIQCGVVRSSRCLGAYNVG